MSETQDSAAADPLAALGREIRAAREAMGLTQKEAAARIGVSNVTLSAIEAGRPGQAAKRKKVRDFFNLRSTLAGESEQARFAGRLASSWVDAQSPERRDDAFDAIVTFMREYPS